MKNKCGNKYKNVIEVIRQRILSGEFPPGFKLPGQNALADEFAVSPITTKRALLELQKNGYIERRSRSGSYVIDKPRIISEVNIVIGNNVENEALWLSEYWEGIEFGAKSLNIPCQLMKISNPAFTDRVLNGAAAQGVILLSFEDINIIQQLSAAGISCVVGEIEAKHAPFNVHVNRRGLTAALVEAMFRSSINKIAFFGNLSQPNHLIAKAGYETAMRSRKKSKPESYDVNEDNIAEKVAKLLCSHHPPEGLIITGGNLPFAALPAIERINPNIKLGVITENRSVLRLKGRAFIAKFNQFEAGKLTFELLYNVAANKVTQAAAWSPPFEILLPQANS
jgi:hypothetical protein